MVEDPDVAELRAPAAGVDIGREPTGTADPDPEDEIQGGEGGEEVGS